MMFCWICTFPGLTYTAQPVFQRSGYASAGFQPVEPARGRRSEPEDDVLMQKAAGFKPEVSALARRE
ncbi:hypothetical protein [Escherichia coli]|uniref:hypothetical protein n=1 Tax=Escherichia coli TaxID=562 RepID=UPI0038908F9A